MLLLCSLPSSYKSFKKTLIYGREKLSFEDVKGHLLSKDKLENEFGWDSKADRQASVLVASKNETKGVTIVRITRKMQLVLIWPMKAVMIYC
ncbi:hypothetical protein Gotri_016197 [Gossypium trilobum]|uniref:Uncharacterized protein n=1 Tax=Gossypium trilobum TaxID=34281 RepID=A0A7J9E2P4_9ROSI|nr:hypothetical protein [Gossypium trilobum]